MTLVQTYLIWSNIASSFDLEVTDGGPERVLAGMHLGNVKMEGGKDEGLARRISGEGLGGD